MDIGRRSHKAVARAMVREWMWVLRPNHRAILRKEFEEAMDAAAERAARTAVSRRLTEKKETKAK